MGCDIRAAYRYTKTRGKGKVMNVLQFLIDIRARNNGVTGEVNRLQQRLDATEQTANRLKRSVGGLKAAFMTLPGAEFFTNPIVAISTGIGVVSKLGMEAGKTAAAFEVMAGSADAGNKILSDINKYADDTIYEKLGVQKATQTMLAFGVAQESILDDLKRIGDIAMGDQDRMNRLALAFGQVSAAGRLTGEDLNQMIDVGFNPLTFISAQTGKSITQLRDEMSKGMISFDDLRKAMILATSEGGKFYNMTETVANTPFGRFQQLVGQFTGVLLELYNVIEPLLIPTFMILSRVMSLITPIIQKLSVAVNWLIDLISDIYPILLPIVTITAAYGAKVLFTTTVLKGWTMAQWAHVTAMIAAEKAQKLLNLAMSLNPVMLIVTGISTLIGVLVWAWNKFEALRASVKATWDMIKGFASMLGNFVINRFKELISAVGSMSDAIYKLFTGDFEGAWQAAQKGAKELVGVESTKQAYSVTKNVLSAVPESYQKYLASEKTISTPEAAGGVVDTLGLTNASSSMPESEKGKSNEVITGGTRNTSITLNISKFFDSLNVSMADRTDTAELQRIILEVMNRSLEIATSAAR